MATLTSAQAARRLGVKLETVYAYVSRGILTSARDADGRSSRFDAGEVEALARRGRPRRASRSPLFEVEIDTSLTEIDGRALRFRGCDATALARAATFEQVAELLWSGSLPSRREPWASMAVEVPDRGDLVDRIRILVATAATHDPGRADLRPEAVAACGRVLVATVVDGLPAAADGRIPRLRLPGSSVALPGTIAGRLWSRLARGRPTAELLAVLNAALVLLVDHELAASTFAARVAASVRADPYAVVGTGLGPVSGPLHGRASRAARQMLDAAAGTSGGPSEMRAAAEAAAAEALRSSGRYPGFGHPLYPAGDPRAITLLELLREAAGDLPGMAVTEAVLVATQRRAAIAPNVDFALAALGSVAGMSIDAGEAIFTIARTAGWLAHAIEEYGEAPARFRPRAGYRGDEGGLTDRSLHRPGGGT